jgi:NAD(P)-dependent dehydrogenase (short-subunit alcohol dehydrogenase family)
MLEKYSLEGKTALITGAAGLLGFQHAIALMESGSNVVLVDIDKSGLDRAKTQLQKQYPGKDRVCCFDLDITDQQSVHECAYMLESEMTIRIDILINNAALDPKVNIGNENLTRLENFSLSQWDIELAVGLKGALIFSQVFGHKMASDEKGGVILNIASDLSVISPDQRLYRNDDLGEDAQPVKPITYSVIKSGLVGMTRYLATYWADKGVRCNALSPGGVYTGQDHEFVKNLTTLIPLGRMAEKDEYRSAVQFLCSDASSYLNGQNIIMDGGRSVW